MWSASRTSCWQNVGKAVGLLRRWRRPSGPQPPLRGAVTSTCTFERACTPTRAAHLPRWRSCHSVDRALRIRHPRSVIAISAGCLLGHMVALPQRYRDLSGGHDYQQRGCFSTTAQGQPPSLPLHKLVKAGDTTAVSKFIQNDPASVHRGDAALNGTTPLLLALRLGYDEIVQVLLENGADVNLAGAWGLTPLMYGAIFGRDQAVASMLKCSQVPINVHATDVHGSTALAHAHAERQHEIVSLLVEHIAENNDDAVALESGDVVMHSASGFNIRPMSAAQIDGAARRLSPLARAVPLEAATESEFKGETIDGTRWDDGASHGLYCGALSGLPLFRGVDKYDSGTGWLSFSNPFDKDHIIKVVEQDGRVEVIDAKSRAHLGHVFEDGPPPPSGSGLRYCINAAALEYLPPDRGEPRFVRGMNRYVMPKEV